MNLAGSLSCDAALAGGAPEPPTLPAIGYGRRGMSNTRREFLRQVSIAGGYRATYLTMQAMGLLGSAAAAEPLALERGVAHRTKVVILGAGIAG